MKTNRCAIALSAFLCSVNFAQAADFDGSRALLCATLEAVECLPGSDRCVRGSAAEFDAPTFLRIDFAGKVIVGPKRTTPIQRMEATGQQLLLQGSELGFGWTLALDTRNGRMVATLVDREGAIALFGACTVP